MTNKERFFVQHTSYGSYAPSTLGAPVYLHDVDQSVFKKDEAEKAKLADMKNANKEALRKVYGKDWKKHLNIPSRSLGNKLVNTF